MDSKVKYIEERLDHFNQIKTNEQNIKIEIEKVSNLKSCPAQKTSEKFKLEKCHFEKHSEKGLKTYMSRKHTQNSSSEYPRKCDLCVRPFDTHNEFKKLLRTHSYEESKFKCVDCNFDGKCSETMDVHMGMSHTDTFVCGICDVSFGNSKDLETHLTTCEIYKCNCHSCDFKQTKLSDIKEHLEKDHGGGK